jgi:cytochrome c oxidase subunit 1
MTLLQDRPETEAAEAPSTAAPATVTETWLDTTDHKRIGLLFIYASLLFVIAGGVLGLIVGLQQAAPGTGLSVDTWFRLYGLHTQMAVLLFLTAMWIGVAAYVVPLQVGAGRVALPRLLSLGFWLYLTGGGIFVASYLVGPVNGAGIVSPAPLAALAAGSNTATNMWIVSLGVISLWFLFASASLFTTVVALRTDGMTILRVPALSWATMVASTVTFVATPIFLGGLLLLGIDQRFGGTFFSAATPGHAGIWLHSVWLYGRPDVYLLTLVALGAATDVVTTNARRPLLSHQAVLVALGLLGAISLTSLATGESVGRAVIVPTYSVPTALVVIPIGVIILLWLGTTALGRPRFHLSVLYVLGAIALWAIGAGNVIAAAVAGVKGLDGNSAWVVGNAHAVVFGPPTLLAVGALYHWAPKMWGRRLNAGIGALVWLTLLAGFAASGMGYYLLGYNGVALRQMVNLSSSDKGLYWLAEVGGALVAVGVLLLILDIVVSVTGRRGKVAGDDPYGGLTLEWATTSPPPRWGFDTVPEVRSAAPLEYLRQAEGHNP